MKKKIFVASSSQSRRELAQNSKLDWVFIPNNFNEDDKKHNYQVHNFIDACNYTKSLSNGKAESVINDVNGIIIGCDSVVYIKGQILEKPKDRNDFDKMMDLLSKYPHYLITGITIIDNIDKKKVLFNEMTKLFFDKFTEQEKNELIDKYHAYDNAGGYTINSCIANKVHIIKGTKDNVIGLPIERIIYEINNL